MKTRPIRVLVTDGGYKHTLGAVRSLGTAGFQVAAIGSERCMSRWSRYLDKVAYPGIRFVDEFMDEFVSFLADSRYDVLLPIGARSVQLISRQRQVIVGHCAVPLASPKAIELCLKKDATYRFATQIGVRVPQTWVFGCLDELNTHMEEIAFPVVVKGASEIWKDRPCYAQKAEQLLNLVAAWGQGIPKPALFPIIQQYISGVGVGFFALYQNGECKRIFMHRRIRETPPSGGASCCAGSIYEPDLLAAGRRLLDALQWHGVAMVEFRRDKDTGELYLMEINPKFWGSLDLALASGVDFPTLDVRMALGEEIPYSEDYRIGLKYHWPLDGELDHVLENPRALFPVFRDCLDPQVKSNVWLTDPLPALSSLHSTVRSLGRWFLNRIGCLRFLHRAREQGVPIALARSFSETTGIPLIRYSRITPKVYLGSQHSHIGQYKLKRLAINAIVNMRSEYDDMAYGLNLEHYCYLPTVEFAAPTLAQLKQGVAFIRRIVQEGGRVFVHCSEGVSRAPTMVAAYLIGEGSTLSEALTLIRRSRPFVNILPMQMERLRQFETEQECGCVERLTQVQ